MSGTHDGRMWRAYRLHFPHTIAYSLAYAKAKRQHTIDKWTSTEAPTATTLSLVCSTHVPSINSKTYTTLAYILASKHRTREEEKYICAHSTVNHAHATTHTHTHTRCTVDMPRNENNVLLCAVGKVQRPQSRITFITRRLHSRCVFPLQSSTMHQCE